MFILRGLFIICNSLLPKVSPTKSMHANCYAALNKSWLGLQSCSCFESGRAGPQSRDFKRYMLVSAPNLTFHRCRMTKTRLKISELIFFPKNSRSSLRVLSSLVWALICTFAWSITAYASSPGDLDTTFNSTGVVTTSITNADIYGTAVVIQPDGKILVGGHSAPEKLTVVRYNDDGALDTAFGANGIATASVGSIDVGIGNLLALDTENRIIMAGTDGFGPTAFHLTAVRYTSNGQLDPSFGNSGVVTTSFSSGPAFGSAVTVQPDHKAIIAGRVNTDLALVRYTLTGTLDTSFNGSGVVTTAIGNKVSEGYDLVTQDDGKIVAAGVWTDGSNSDFLVARYHSNGSLDTSFNGSGIVTTSLTTGQDDISYYGIAVQDDYKIIAVGEGRYAGSAVMVVARYQQNGDLDSTFNGTGVVTTSIGMGAAAADVAIQANGKILVAGVAVENGRGNVALVRYSSNGSLDAAFGGTGIITTSISNDTDDIGRGTAIQPDGKIVVTGFTYGSDGKRDVAVMRYLGDSYSTFIPLILKQSL
jgi:uncharacterized delta-60 repeat protein